MELADRRHDIFDKIWRLLELHLSGRAGSLGGVAQDNRLFINVVSGSCAPMRSGGISRRITVTGRMPIAGFAAGETKGFGSPCWNNWLMSRTMSG